MNTERNLDAILELMDGRCIHAELVRPFTPDDNEILVKPEQSGSVQRFFLAKVCCVLMKPDFQQLGNEQYAEEVVTSTGKIYHVAVLSNPKSRTGFYAFQSEVNSPYRLIFFTNHGVMSRKRESFIGEILRKEGLATPESIHEVLEEQKRLRERRLGDVISEEHGIIKKSIENAIETAYREGKVTPRMRIGDILVKSGVISAEQMTEALSNQEDGKKKRVGKLLVEKGLITEDQLLMALALKFRLRFVDMEAETPSQDALDLVPANMAHELKILPLALNEQCLIVATSEPTNSAIPDSLRFYLKRPIEMVVASPDQISREILKRYPSKDVDEILQGAFPDIGDEPELEPTEADSGISESDSHIVMLVNQILQDGYNKGASDIHFEPGFRSEPFQVRYRIDGTCRVVHQIPSGFKRAIISRIKIMSNLDISERRKPQSGKILITSHDQKIEYRVEISPTVGGNEDAVLRILTSAEPLPLEDMGFSESNLKAFRSILKQPYGMILCVGPTGSGKTTTLHSALKSINTPEVKIWTVEDPVEITQKGLRQVQVHAKIGLTFQEALRSFLRSDPDIIMVGEMRDAETTKIALEASLTGHLVLSTLHTNSAPETVARLIEMGMDPFNFSDSLLGVLAQRLARRLCVKCKETYHPDPDEYDELMMIYDRQWFQEHNMQPYSPDLTLMRRVGCEACNGGGYKGRIAIHELLANTDSIKQLIRRRAEMDELRKTAIREGMKTLQMDGVEKVFQGLTDRDELLRVCRLENSGG